MNGLDWKFVAVLEMGLLMIRKTESNHSGIEIHYLPHSL